MSNKIFETELSVLYNADCVAQMKELIKQNIKVDKVITSPPYNTQRASCSDRGYDEYKDDKTEQEYIDWILSIFECYDKLLNINGCIMWNMSYGAECPNLMNLCIADIIRNSNFELADILIWKKPSATPNNVSPNKMTRICEFVYIFVRKGESATFTANKKKLGEREDTKQPIYENKYNFIVAENNDGSTDLNKATFSTQFVDALLDRYVCNGDVVLDNFSGTGTTMYACERRNIKGIYIELSKAQCEYTKKRLSVVQLTMFDLI